MSSRRLVHGLFVNLIRSSPDGRRHHDRRSPRERPSDGGAERLPGDLQAGVFGGHERNEPARAITRASASSTIAKRAWVPPMFMATTSKYGFRWSPRLPSLDVRCWWYPHGRVPGSRRRSASGIAAPQTVHPP